MKAFILTSMLYTYKKDKYGHRKAIRTKNKNGIVKTIKELVPEPKSLVWVCNFEDAYEENDERANTVYKSLAKAGIKFQNFTALDGRNKKDAKKLITSADLVILSGGKILSQKAFCEGVNMAKLLKASNALVIGISAGAMNLCQKVFNFPEEEEDKDEPRVVCGLGFFDGFIIPHLDGKKLKYQLPYHNINCVDEYILPFSQETKLIGIDNNSHILVKGGVAKVCGKVYEIYNKKSYRIKSLS